MKLRHNPAAFRETCPRGLCVGRPAVASFCDVHAPAASLGRRQAPPLGDGLAATVSPRAQFQRCGQPFRRSLGLAPWPTLKAVLLVRLTLSRLGPPRTASLSSAACASVGRRSPPCVAGPVARLALSRRTPRAASRSAARSPYMSASAPGGCGSSASLRSRASGRAASPLLPSVPRPARARVFARALADGPAPPGQPPLLY